MDGEGLGDTVAEEVGVGVEVDADEVGELGELGEVVVADGVLEGERDGVA